jgi:probable HAF family extracellular repeat protein
MRLLALFYMLPAILFGGTVYTWTDMGTYGGASTTANGLNNKGEVVGGYFVSGGFHAWRYSGGVFTDLGTMGGVISEANAINDSGQITGRSQIANGNEVAFLYQGGLFTNIGSLGGRARSDRESMKMGG